MLLCCTCTTTRACCSKSTTIRLDVARKTDFYTSLFRPYIKLDLRGAGLYPRDTCTYCANEISSLMNVLRAMYGLRRVVHLVCSVVMSASTIHLLNLPSEVAAAHLGQGLHDLQAMSTNHLFAARCVDIIRGLATKWNLALPETAATSSVYRGGRQWPSPPSSTFFAASIPRQGSSETGTRSGSSISSGPPQQPDNPFPPPAQHPQRVQRHLSHQQSQHVPTFYSDPTIPMDPNQAQHALWTPFPVQGVPVQTHQGLNDMALDFTTTPVDSMQGMQWSMFGDSAGPTSDPSNLAMTCGAMMNSTMHTLGPDGGMGGGGMGGTLNDWSWQ